METVLLIPRRSKFVVNPNHLYSTLEVFSSTSARQRNCYSSSFTCSIHIPALKVCGDHVNLISIDMTYVFNEYVTRKGETQPPGNESSIHNFTRTMVEIPNSTSLHTL